MRRAIMAGAMLAAMGGAAWGEPKEATFLGPMVNTAPAAYIPGDAAQPIVFSWPQMKRCATAGDQVCRAMLAARLDGWRAAGGKGEPPE